MQRLPLLRVVVQWSQPLNYSPARSTSSSRLIIMPLISCSNWSLPLKYDSTIWSFIKKLFFWNCWERFCVFKKACSMFCCRRLRRNKRRKKRGGKRRQVVPIITHFCVGEPEVVPGPQPPPPTRPALRLSSSSQSSEQPWQRGRGMGPAQETRHHFQTLPLLACV